MVGDGKTPYDTRSDGKINEVGSCVQDFTNREWATKAKIQYVKNGYLQVWVNVRNSVDWEDCFLVPNVTLPDAGYLGFTSHTGDVYGKCLYILIFLMLISR